MVIAWVDGLVKANKDGELFGRTRYGWVFASDLLVRGEVEEAAFRVRGFVEAVWIGEERVSVVTSEGLVEVPVLREGPEVVEEVWPAVAEATPTVTSDLIHALRLNPTEMLIKEDGIVFRFDPSYVVNGEVEIEAEVDLDREVKVSLDVLPLELPKVLESFVRIDATPKIAVSPQMLIVEEKRERLRYYFPSPVRPL